ncbi:MAG: hypothetical protein IJK52_06310 [Oscillospiraceae bacterium]|nr:hypothetical protein [Oscillospiraceae bacterium]
MKIKRLLSLMMATVMGLTLFGCGGARAEDSGISPLNANVPAFDDDPEPESLPFFASLFNAKETPAPVAGEIAKAVYPSAVPYPTEDDYTDESGSFDSEAYFQAYEKWSEMVSARPDLTPEETESLHAFFRDSAKQFLKGDKNRAYSPLNIYMALAMLSGLTAGNTQAQILKLLNAETPDALSVQANRIWNALYTDDGTSTTILGSSLWLNQTVAFNADTLKKLSETFYASSYTGEMGSPAFDAALQAWLNEQTRGLLSEQAGGVAMSPDTLLALATTIYFKAKWRDQFSEYATKTDVFHAVSGDRDAPFMRQTYTGNYYKGDGFSAVYKPLWNSGMWLLLPDEDKTPADLLESGAAMNFISNPEQYATSSRAEIALSLPKFDVSADLNLIDGLKSLGVTDAFDGDVSDFSPMSEMEGVEIGQAKHAARVKIDEEGCEAAAFTVMTAIATAVMTPPPRVEFTLDRPFAFAVTAENLPLFVGVVQTPLDA